VNSRAKFGFHVIPIADSALPTRARQFSRRCAGAGTLIGTGERCGNVNLTTMVGSMQLRGEAEFVPPQSLNGLTALAHSAYAALGWKRTRRAIVGQAHSALGGEHGSSERKNPGRISGAIPR